MHRKCNKFNIINHIWWLFGATVTKTTSCKLYFKKRTVISSFGFLEKPEPEYFRLSEHRQPPSYSIVLIFTANNVSLASQRRSRLSDSIWLPAFSKCTVHACAVTIVNVKQILHVPSSETELYKK